MSEPHPANRDAKSLRRLALRLILALGAAGLTLLAVEGVWSIRFGWSLLRSLAGDPPELRLQWEELLSNVEAERGNFAAHADPRVGFVLRRERELTQLRAEVTTDALGLRRRAGGEVAGPQLRIAVVGDSIAFGDGLADAETFAARLEAHLGEARGPGAAPVVARTVAVPGWNTRNSVAFLLDHFDEIRPDLVLHWPIENDLADTAPQAPGLIDPFSERPWMRVDPGVNHSLVIHAARRLKADGRPLPTAAQLGAFALLADLTPESSRRYDSVAEEIGRLKERLDRDGIPLVLLHAMDGPFIATVRERLELSGLRLTVVHLLGRALPADTLGWDPHPNARTTDALALWTARDLLARGLVAGDVERLRAEIPRALEGRRSPALAPAEYLTRASGYREEARRAMVRSIEFEGARGLNQVLGGLSPEGIVGPGLLAALPGGCGELDLAVDPLAERPDLGPLTVDVVAGGERLGSFRVPAGGGGEVDARSRFELPEAMDGAPFEVELRPSDWVVIESRGRWLPAAFRLRSMRCGAAAPRGDRLTAAERR